jgi:hypothetical protein
VGTRKLYRLAGKISKAIQPLLIILGFSGPKVDPQRSEAGCAGGLRRAAEHIRPPGDLEIDKTCGYDRSL